MRLAEIGVDGVSFVRLGILGRGCFVVILAAAVTVTVRTDLFCSLLKSFECLSI